MPDLFAVHGQLAQPFGHHRHAFDRSARRRDASAAAVDDAFLPRQLLGDLDEEPRLQLVEDVRVMGPVVVVLGEPVGRAHHGELVAVPVHVLVGLELLRHRVRGDLRVQRVVGACLDRLVMFGERPVVQHRRVEASDPLRQHDESAVLPRR